MQKNKKIFLRWGLRPQTSLPFAAAGGFALQAPKTPPTLRISGCVTGVIIAVMFFLCKLILRLAGVGGFLQAALSLNKFAHPCSIVCLFAVFIFTFIVYQQIRMQGT